MMFFGLFMLVVLPLFLIVSVHKMKQSPRFKHDPAMEFVAFIFYLFAGMAILADVMIIAQLFQGK